MEPVAPNSWHGDDYEPCKAEAGTSGTSGADTRGPGIRGSPHRRVKQPETSREREEDLEMCGGCVFATNVLGVDSNSIIFNHRSF